MKSFWCEVRCARIAKNFFSLISEIKRIWISFTCVSLFHYKISLLSFRFFSLIFASNFSLRFTLVIFASKWNKPKRNSSVFFRFFNFFSHFFAIFSHFFAYFRFFRFTFFASLPFSHFCFEAKRSEAKFKSIFSLFSRFFHFFSLFSLFFAFFRFASIFSLNFRLFYLRFCFRFLVFRIEVNHVKSGFFSLPSEAKFSLQFQISLPKRKWGRTLMWSELSKPQKRIVTSW